MSTEPMIHEQGSGNEFKAMPGAGRTLVTSRLRFREGVEAATASRPDGFFAARIRASVEQTGDVAAPARRTKNFPSA
jgi:hypothetical protein